MIVELIIVLGFLLPLMIIGVAIFACELRIQYRDNHDSRFPRPGITDDETENP